MFNNRAQYPARLYTYSPHPLHPHTIPTLELFPHPHRTSDDEQQAVHDNDDDDDIMQSWESINQFEVGLENFISTSLRKKHSIHRCNRVEILYRIQLTFESRVEFTTKVR